MDTIEKNEFLRGQLDLLKRKQTDENLEWQDVADFRSEYIGDLEHRDTVRKGSKLLYEYIDAGWVKYARKKLSFLMLGLSIIDLLDRKRVKNLMLTW